MDGELSFDVLAAALRVGAADTTVFAEALAKKLEYFAIGTAVVPADADHELATPMTLVSLDGRGGVSGAR